MAERVRTKLSAGTDQHTIRVLVAGVTGAGNSELIQYLVDDLASCRWDAVGNEGVARQFRADFGLVRLSAEALLCLIAVRAEKRFRSLWDKYLPQALGIILLVTSRIPGCMDHIHTFLKAREALDPTIPLHAFVSNPEIAVTLPGLDGFDMSSRSIHDQTLRLHILDRLLEQWLGRNVAEAKVGR